MAIVFGSPEAMAILKEDKFQQRLENDESAAELKAQVDALNASIEELEDELSTLLGERAYLKVKLHKLREGQL